MNTVAHGDEGPLTPEQSSGLHSPSGEMLHTLWEALCTLRLICHPRTPDIPALRLSGSGHPGCSRCCLLIQNSLPYAPPVRIHLDSGGPGLSSARRHSPRSGYPAAAGVSFVQTKKPPLFLRFHNSLSPVPRAVLIVKTYSQLLR